MEVLYFALTEKEKFLFRYLPAQHSFVLNAHFCMETNQQMVFSTVVLVLPDNGLNRLVFVFTDAWLKVIHLVFWHQME